MWRKYKEVSKILSNEDTVIIPDDYLHRDEIQGQSPFTEKYGSSVDQPITPANATIPMTNGLATAGTLRTAHLQDSHSSNQGTPSPDREVVTFDTSQLSREDKLHHNDLHRVYRELLMSVFRSNDKRLSRRFIENLLEQTVNDENSASIKQL